MICPECNLRPVKCRERCQACYSRHRYHNTVADLPQMRQGRPPIHSDEGCPICEEVDALSGYGYSGEAIAQALGMTPEAVHVHVRRYSPHLMHVTIHASNEYIRARTRKATA